MYLILNLINKNMEVNTNYFDFKCGHDYKLGNTQLDISKIGEAYDYNNIIYITHDKDSITLEITTPFYQDKINMKKSEEYSGNINKHRLVELKTSGNGTLHRETNICIFLDNKNKLSISFNRYKI